MITNEQIAKLRTMAGFDDVLLADELPALRAAIDTLDKLPTYADTGARFVPGVDESWIVIDNGVGEPDDDTPRYVVNQVWPRFTDEWQPAEGIGYLIWTGHFYSTEAAAERAAKEAKP